MLFRSYRLVGAAKKAGCALGSRQRGRLTSHPERERIVTLIREALAAGARLQRACNEAGICLRTWRRWLRNGEDRKSTRLNSSHVAISYAVFCLKKKNDK